MVFTLGVGFLVCLVIVDCHPGVLCGFFSMYRNNLRPKVKAPVPRDLLL